MLLILLQVWVLDNVSLGGFVIPYAYVLFVLLLPFNINKSLMLIIAFFTGLIMDFFGNTLGLHAASLVLMAFARPAVLNFYFPRIETQPGDEPGINKLGMGGFIKYAFSLILIFQIALTFLEVFTFHHFFALIWQSVLGAFATTFVVLLLELLFARRNKRRLQ
ncbi:MAG: rod shape-determining protein MreD [Bacteroidales bacterium]|nr:rod shape-determining protein MreD [Bacteroidales bacterium]